MRWYTHTQYIGIVGGGEASWLWDGTTLCIHYIVRDNGSVWWNDDDEEGNGAV